jgi:succinate-semialdehyde dehydrogenase/glutarate-semialdehyde dehydrogenase
MTPTAAARAQPSAAMLRDRLKDPSLLRENCYIDGAWVGTPALPVTNPANGAELAKVPQMSAADDPDLRAGQAAGRVSGRSRYRRRLRRILCRGGAAGLR